MADQELKDLTAVASLQTDDIFYLVRDPSGSPLDRKVAVSVFDDRYLLESNNLSDLVSASTAATNLGLGTGDSPSFTALTVSGNDGIDIGGTGADVDLVTADAGAGVIKWDDSEGRFSLSTGLILEIGQLDILDNGVINPTRISNGQFNSPSIFGQRARGSLGSESAVQDGDRLFSFGVFGYGATGYSAQARGRVEFYATENWDDSNQGSRLEFRTTEDGTTSTSVKMALDNDGGLEILADISTDTAPNDDTTIKRLSLQRLSAAPTNAAYIQFSNGPGSPTNEFYLVLEEA